jgi:hypothetical protein
VAKKKYTHQQTQLFAPSVDTQLPADFFPAGIGSGTGTAFNLPRAPNEIIRSLTRETTKETLIVSQPGAGTTDVTESSKTETEIEPPKIADAQASSAAEVEVDDVPPASANPTQAVERFFREHYGNIPITGIILLAAITIVWLMVRDNDARALNSAIGFGWCLTRTALVVSLFGLLCIPLSFLDKSKDLATKAVVACIAAIVMLVSGGFFLVGLAVMTYVEWNSSDQPATPRSPASQQRSTDVP